MEAIIHIKSDFKCVYLVNGVFFEHADSLRYRVNEPLYLTVLPLSAHFMSYTVKILNGKALNNETLCRSYKLSDEKYLTKLFPRYNYVYSPGKKEPYGSGGKTLCENFFTAVKSGNLSAARRCLTESLSSSIDNDSLLAFFNDYSDIIIDEFSAQKKPHSYYLIDNNLQGSLFSFVLYDNLIDDIVQE